MALSTCRHTGSEMCDRCSWERPYEAGLLVLRGRTARRALPVAAVVGTVLSLVNQAAVILDGTASGWTWARVAVNYLVPFVVASVGYLGGRRVSAPEPNWPSYLADFHQERAGTTERVLGSAVTGDNQTPYRWLAEPLRGDPGPILDLACGSAPTRPLLPGARWLGVDTSAGELAAAAAEQRGPLARAGADELPASGGSISAVCGAMCFPVLTPIEPVLAEVARVLRPDGRLVALVPSSRLGPRKGLFRWWRLLRALGLRGQPWPNPQARDGLATMLRTHGFVVDLDERRVFRREIAGPADAAALIESLYLPGVDPARVQAATRMLGAWARPGRTLPLPLRRVVAHLPGG